MRKLSALTFVSALIVAQSAFAQDPVFTDHSFATSSVNPALTGTYGYLRAESVYRLQWPKLAGNYKTFTMYADAPSRICNVGFQYLNDNAGGFLKTNRFDLNLSFPVRFWKDSLGVGKVVLQPGVQLSYLRKTVDWSELTFGDMIDPQSGFVYQSAPANEKYTTAQPDISAGLLAYHKRFSAGLAVFHITEPNQGFMGNSPLPMRFVYHFSGVIGNVDTDNMDAWRIVPAIFYSRQGNMEVAAISVNGYYQRYRFGAGCRNRDALFFIAGISASHFTVSYSYDVTVSYLKGLTGGAHEVHLRYSFLENKTGLARSNMRMHY